MVALHAGKFLANLCRLEARFTLLVAFLPLALSPSLHGSITILYKVSTYNVRSTYKVSTHCLHIVLRYPHVSHTKLNAQWRAIHRPLVDSIYVHTIHTYLPISELDKSDALREARPDYSSNCFYRVERSLISSEHFRKVSILRSIYGRKAAEVPQVSTFMARASDWLWISCRRLTSYSKLTS